MAKRENFTKGQGRDTVEEISVTEKEEINGPKTTINWGGLRPDFIPKEPIFEISKTEIFRVTPQRQSHISGFSKIKMVMYVQRVDFIVDLFDVHGIEEAEIIVGDSE